MQKGGIQLLSANAVVEEEKRAASVVRSFFGKADPGRQMVFVNELEVTKQFIAKLEQIWTPDKKDADDPVTLILAMHLAGGAEV